MPYKNKEDKRKQALRYYHEKIKTDPNKVQAKRDIAKAHYLRNQNELRIKAKERMAGKYQKTSTRLYLTDPNERYINSLLHKAKTRCVKSGLEFDISYKDIRWETHCPILGTELIPKSKDKRHQITLDRVDNTKGYVKGNVRIISNFANSCKSSLSREEIEKLYLYSR